MLLLETMPEFSNSGVVERCTTLLANSVEKGFSGALQDTEEELLVVDSLAVLIRAVKELVEVSNSGVVERCTTLRADPVEKGFSGALQDTEEELLVVDSLAVLIRAVKELVGTLKGLTGTVKGL